MSSTSTSISPPQSYISSWQHAEASRASASAIASGSGSKYFGVHLQVPLKGQYASSASTSMATSRASGSARGSGSKRKTRESVSPPRRKRVREPTPIREREAESDQSHHPSAPDWAYGNEYNVMGSAPTSGGPPMLITAGPSSYAHDISVDVDVQEDEVEVAQTSEGAEGEDSALFSEQTHIIPRTQDIDPDLDQEQGDQHFGIGIGLGNGVGMDILDFGADPNGQDGIEPSTEPTETIDPDPDMNALQEHDDNDITIRQGDDEGEGEPPQGDFFVEEQEEEDEEAEGEEYFVEQEDRLEPQDTDPDAQLDHEQEQEQEQEESTLVEPSHSTSTGIKSMMPPPTDTRSHSTTTTTSSRKVHDRMTQVIERTVDLNEDEKWEAERDEDQPWPSSYHSGDSDDYEMDHRPVLERTAVKRDIRAFIDSSLILSTGVNGLRPYKIVDRLGEGTFSSVYLAHDQLHNEYSNSYWTGCSDDQLVEPSSIKVALKKILVTSSPARIENELAILESLRGCRNVSQLITAFREEDQVIIVLPYHRSDDFRHFYRHMDPPHMRSYLRCLFRALKDIHKRGIVHRDVKPANFLYDYETEEGILVDYGLAERYYPPRRPTCQHAPATLSSLQGSKTKTAETPAVEQAVYDARKRAKAGEGRVGFPHEDKRPPMKTNRAGTRGFRAPEVLLKCPDQTVAIDTWSAGVMLLSILTHKFPVFNSSDDIEALMEISAIFGRAAMERCAMLHNRTIITTVPTVDTAPPNLSSLILRLNPHIYTPHMSSPTPDDAREHIESIDQAIDLCTRLLRLDATKRLTAAQALRHPFLAPTEEEDDDDQSQSELVHPAEGKCGALHEIQEGKHRAYFHPDLRDLHFGQGIPPSRESLCPEHEHYQDRFLMNPLATRYYVNNAVDDAREDEEDDRYFDAERQKQGIKVEEGFIVEDLHERRGATVPLRERDVNLAAITTTQSQGAGTNVDMVKREGYTVERRLWRVEQEQE